MSIEIKISLNEGLYLKEPQESKLGRNIIKHSILMIDEFGFECFNFKKLAKEINSTEASIYRYFENKHLLLLFLVNWYWEWVSYLIKINTMNIDDPRKILKIIIHSFVAASKDNPGVIYVNESRLHNIVISEGMKAYHTKEVDKEHSKGFFKSYENLVKSVSDVIKEINSDFEFPFALATNLFEMSNNQIFFAKHLPNLTDVSIDKDAVNQVEDMLNYFADKLLV
ncbi:TetR/AcrR family transcriptional regulator [Tenacibaculum ovolyticum]|uniref:TetR/AcrR family transcriptional regulator n=2 Tax=Tenacibaculum ovolyticum TaxID=104270 RepID=UPI0022F3EF91|nr:TetR/AcrR family transcriptional regulator [Tenacibaculum ovolyticum]WBX78122.1 TetR/AcrR family transcriptional regulator [Tenacibaculum ovolyticum]